jgi:LmbE family N-acetylglucosaminyl deacetylase
LLLCQSPEWNYDRIYASHPDHRAAGEAALCAVYPDARNPFAHVELAQSGYEAWSVSETWIMGTETPNHCLDVTDHLPKKLAALKAHESQTAHMDVEALLRERMGEVAAKFDLPPGRLAEAFRVVDSR